MRKGEYFLTRSAETLSVGEIIRFVDGSMAPVPCTRDEETGCCPFSGKCVFLSMWKEAQEATEAVYDRTSLQDLIERESEAMVQHDEHALTYHI